MIVPALSKCGVVQYDTVPNGYVAMAIHQLELDGRVWRQAYADNRGAFTVWHGTIAPQRIEFLQDSVPGGG